jgi:curved DNA-binding protein CbpA
MQVKDLKHFNINDSLQDLRKQWIEYGKSYHPDKFKSDKSKADANNIMAAINAEYDFVKNEENRKKNESSKAQPFKAQENTNGSKDREEAQADLIYEALTNASGVNYNKLIPIINEVKDWGKLLTIYKDKYTSSVLDHIIRYVKNKKAVIDLKDKIQGELMKQAMSGSFLGDIILAIFKNL